MHTEPKRERINNPHGYSPFTFEDAAAIVHPVKAKPDHRAKLQKAIDAFTHDAEYRMEALDDVQALETLGEEIAQAILNANLGNRSNCHGLETIKGVGYNRAPNMADAVDFFCDGLSSGADIVRYAALSMLDQKALDIGEAAA